MASIHPRMRHQPRNDGVVNHKRCVSRPHSPKLIAFVLVWTKSTDSWRGGRGGCRSFLLQPHRGSAFPHRLLPRPAGAVSKTWDSCLPDFRGQVLNSSESSAWMMTPATFAHLIVPFPAVLESRHLSRRESHLLSHRLFSPDLIETYCSLQSSAIRHSQGSKPPVFYSSLSAGLPL